MLHGRTTRIVLRPALRKDIRRVADMSRVFSIPTALRVFPAELLAQFFERLGHRVIAGHCRGSRTDRIKRIQEAIGNFSNARKLDAIESPLHTLFDLACDTGIVAIYEAGSWCDPPRNLVDTIPGQNGMEGKVLWVWLNYPEVIEAATKIHQVDHLTWWRKRTDLPKKPPEKCDETLHRLKGLLSAKLAAEQGRGRILTVESMQRNGTEYSLAYPDDYLQTVTTHDARKRLVPRMLRQTFLIVFAFDPASGSLELFAKLPAKLKGEIEAIFAKTVLHFELGPWKSSEVFKLNHLKERCGPLETDPADRVQAQIRAFHLKPKNSRRLIVLKADPQRENDIFAMLHQVIDKKRVPLSSLEVKLVTFCFEFLELGDRKKGSMVFNVAYPDKCNLRNQPQEWIEVARRCLKKWGIDAS